MLRLPFTVTVNSAINPYFGRLGPLIMTRFIDPRVRQLGMAFDHYTALMMGRGDHTRGLEFPDWQGVLRTSG